MKNKEKIKKQLMKTEVNLKKFEETEQEKNEFEDDDGVKTICAYTFPMHLQPNATSDNIQVNHGKTVQHLQDHAQADWFGIFFWE